MRRRTFLGGLVLFCTGCAGNATRNSYPEQDIEILIPYAPGGPTDVSGRKLGTMLEKHLKVTISPVNKEAGSGVAAGAYVKGEPADGYTLLYAPTGTLLQPVIREAPWAIDDFVAVAGVVEQPFVYIVRSDSQFEDLEALLDSDEGIKYGTSGVGTTQHTCAAAIYNKLAGGAQDVPFDGSSPAMAALLGGHVDAAALEPDVVVPRINAGKVRALAVSSDKRSDFLPKVPSVKELGHELGHEAPGTTSWGLLVRADTAESVIKTLQKEVREVTSLQTFERFLKKHYMSPSPDPNGQQWLKQEKADVKKYAALQKQLGIEVSG